MKFLASFLAVLLSAIFAYGQDGFRPIFNPPASRINEALAQDQLNFQTLLRLLKQANLKELQSADASYTLLAPTDDAFSKLPKGYLDKVASDPSALQSFLKMHLIPGKVVFKQVFSTNETVKTGQSVKHTFYDANKKTGFIQCKLHPVTPEKEHHPLINDKAKVLKSDIEGTYSVIHVIDAVLVPEP